VRFLGDSAAAAAPPLLRDSLQARELIYRLFSALATAERAESGAADGADADGLADLVARAPVRSDLVFAPGAAGWRVAMITPSVGEVLAPVLWSAADLALAAQRVRLRQCANPRCRWLFLDDSKGGTRRWCSMSACGNRAKAHRHFLRQAEARLKDAPSG
jgi:predicted RNA-binding Zn ribbon-like protein